MPAAGLYNTRLRWLVCTRTRDEDTGDLVGTHSPNGYLWCSVVETNGRRQTDAGATQTGADAEIRVRNYPTVSPLDLLEDEVLGYVWHLDSISNGDDELIVTAYRNDVLVDYEIEEE